MRPHIGQTSGFVVDRRLPSPPPMDVDALCLISDPGAFRHPLTLCRTFSLVDVRSLVLFSGGPGGRSTHRNRPTRSQFQPKTSPFLSPPQTDRPSITPLSPLPTPSLPIFKRQFQLEIYFPPWGPQISLPSPSCVDRDPFFFSGTHRQPLSNSPHLRACQVVCNRERKPGGLDLPWPRAR